MNRLESRVNDVTVVDGAFSSVVFICPKRVQPFPELLQVRPVRGKQNLGENWKARSICLCK